MDREIELLGARVKACREEEGMTLLDLAERAVALRCDTSRDPSSSPRK